MTVVVPTYNERASLVDCIESLIPQLDDETIVLVVDGGSDDGTVEMAREIAAEQPLVRVVDNPRRTAAAAMNTALQQVHTDLLLRADAHSIYAADYVQRSVEVSAETGATNVGGPMRPAGTTRFGRAVAAVTTTRVGMGSGAFHWTDRRREVDTVYLGCYRVDALREVGGWDEHLQWAAEDQELNYRLRAAGHRIVCDPTIQSWYFPRATPRALWRQYHNYGVCKVATLLKHGRTPTLRAVAPATLVATLAASAVASIIRRRLCYLFPAAGWGVVIGATAARLGRTPGVDASRAALAVGICHLGHGVGFWHGLALAFRGAPWQTRPSGHR